MEKATFYLLWHGTCRQLFISNNGSVQLWPPYCVGLQALALTLDPLPHVTLHGDQSPHANETPFTFSNIKKIYLYLSICLSVSLYLSIYHLSISQSIFTFSGVYMCLIVRTLRIDFITYKWISSIYDFVEFNYQKLY